MQPDGSAKVREEIALRFGARSGRHGLARKILVQSPVSRTHDARWPVEKITAGSPSGHAATVHTDLAMSRDGRTQMLWIRLGNSLHTIDDPTARYVLEYTWRGLVRPSVDGDVEFSINVGGPRLWSGPSAGLDRGLASTFANLQVDRDWTPPTPTSGPASWFSGGSGSGSGGAGGGSSFGSGDGGGSGGSGGSFGSR